MKHIINARIAEKRSAFGQTRFIYMTRTENQRRLARIAQISEPTSVLMEKREETETSAKISRRHEMNGELLNLAFEYLAWHNFGTEYFVIIGRDFGFFLIGYIFCMTVGTIAEAIKEGRKK